MRLRCANRTYVLTVILLLHTPSLQPDGWPAQSSFTSNLDHTSRPSNGEIDQLAHLIQRHADVWRFFVAQDHCKRVEDAELIGWKRHVYIVLHQQIDEFIHVMRPAKHDAVIFGDGLEAFFNGLLGEKARGGNIDFRMRGQRPKRSEVALGERQ